MQLSVRNSVFRAMDGFSEPAITSGGNSNQLIVADCTFFDYRKIGHFGQMDLLIPPSAAVGSR